MNTLVVLTTILAVVFAQKPGYLSGNSGQPELAYRFRTGEQSSTTPAPLGNRLGGTGTGTGTTPKIPVDARGDYDLVNRLLTWPKENRPYWLINYEAIEKFRNQQNPNGNAVQQQGQQTNLQSRFGETETRRNRNPGFNPNVDYDDFGNPIYTGRR